MSRDDGGRAFGWRGLPPVAISPPTPGAATKDEEREPPAKACGSPPRGGGQTVMALARHAGNLPKTRWEFQLATEADRNIRLPAANLRENSMTNLPMSRAGMAVASAVEFMGGLVFGVAPKWGEFRLELSFPSPVIPWGHDELRTGLRN